MKRRRITIISIFVAAFVVCAGIWSYTTFFRYQSNIRELVAQTKSEEGELPQNVLAVLTKLNIENADSSNYARLLSRCRGTQGLRPLEIVAYKFTWQALLPLVANKSERLSIYTALMPFDGGSGLKFGANQYFAKNLDELSTDEVLTLVARSKNPAYFRDNTHLADLEEKIEILRRKYETAP